MYETQPDNSTQDYHYLNDAGGNVVKVLNADDLSVANEYEYGPFGQTIAKTETVDNPYQYNTKYHDEETGLLYYGFRFYDNKHGRWVNQDPVGVNGGVNVYNSVSNNMVNGYVHGLSLSSGMNMRLGQLRLGLGVDFWGLWYFTRRYNDRNPGHYDDYRCHYTQHYRTGVGFVMEAGDTANKLLTDLGLRRSSQALGDQVSNYFPGDYRRKAFRNSFILLSDNLDNAIPDDDRLPMLVEERSISAAGSAFIANYEGFSATVYTDAAGHPTIGYGHLIQPGENYTDVTLTRQQALDLKSRDMDRFATGLQNNITAPITQYQYDALISFAYNIGVGGFRRSSALRELNNRNYNLVPARMALWNRGGGRVLRGLVNRRADEGELFRDGDYVRNH